MDVKHWVVEVHWVEGDGNLVEENHTFTNFDKAKGFLEKTSAYWNSVYLYNGTEDSETGEIVGTGKPILKEDKLREESYEE